MIRELSFLMFFKLIVSANLDDSFEIDCFLKFENNELKNDSYENDESVLKEIKMKFLTNKRTRSEIQTDYKKENFELNKVEKDITKIQNKFSENKKITNVPEKECSNFNKVQNKIYENLNNNTTIKFLTSQNVFSKMTKDLKTNINSSKKCFEFLFNFRTYSPKINILVKKSMKNHIKNYQKIHFDILNNRYDNVDICLEKANTKKFLLSCCDYFEKTKFPFGIVPLEFAIESFKILSLNILKSKIFSYEENEALFNNDNFKFLIDEINLIFSELQEKLEKQNDSDAETLNLYSYSDILKILEKRFKFFIYSLYNKFNENVKIQIIRYYNYYWLCIESIELLHIITSNTFNIKEFKNIYESLIKRIFICITKYSILRSSNFESILKIKMKNLNKNKKIFKSIKSRKKDKFDKL